MIILSGGTGTPKFIRGLRRIILDEQITVIVNTAEDLWVSGGFVSPDVDTILYLFSDQLDINKFWGIKNDTFYTNQKLKQLGYNEKLLIGDRDRATHILRAEYLKNGMSLTKATSNIASLMGIKAKILPMSDDNVSTFITTNKGKIHFQDFWITNKGKLDVLDIEFSGIESAKPSKQVIEALKNEDKVIIGPSNPITSILPIISLKGIKEILKNKKVIAISPIIGNAPLSGPAGKFMQAFNYEVSSYGVYECYKDFLDVLIIDIRDENYEFPIRIEKYDTIMDSIEKSESLARFVLSIYDNWDR